MGLACDQVTALLFYYYIRVLQKQFSEDPPEGDFFGSETAIVGGLTVTLFVKGPQGFTTTQIHQTNRVEIICCRCDSQCDSLRFSVSVVCLAPICIINLKGKNRKGLNNPTMSFLPPRHGRHFFHSRLVALLPYPTDTPSSPPLLFWTLFSPVGKKGKPSSDP